MAWIAIPHKSKDDAFGSQSFNIISDDINYLKTQSEVLVAAAGTTTKLLGLGYPGGPVIDRLAPHGDPNAVTNPASATRRTHWPASGVRGCTDGKGTMRSERMASHHLRMPSAWSGLVAMAQMTDAATPAASMDASKSATFPLPMAFHGHSASRRVMARSAT